MTVIQFPDRMPLKVAKWHPLSGSHLPAALSIAGAAISAKGVTTSAKSFARAVANGDSTKATLSALGFAGSLLGVPVSAIVTATNIEEGWRGRFWKDRDPKTYNGLVRGTTLGRLASSQPKPPAPQEPAWIIQAR
ncbi:MAG: hypothetical protein U0R17_02940 [Acidimicrobiia bacterium]